MSDDSGEKSHQATPKKRREARRKGQVSQSHDLSSLLVLAVVAEAATLMADDSLQRLGRLMLFPLGRLRQPFTATLMETLVQAGQVLLAFSLMTVGVAMAMRVLAAWLQIGFLFAPEALKPDFNRLNPLSQARQMFSGQALMNLLMGLLKAVFLGVVIYSVTRPALGALIALTGTDLPSYWQGLTSLFRRILHNCLGVLLVLAMVDFGLQRYFFARRLRMTEQEVRKEFKEMEGDPHVKLHRRQLARSLVEQAPTAQREVEKADLLVVNPTHYAVALFYRPEQTPLPVLVDKGTDAQARRLIARAQAAQVPVIQCVWLARTLHREPLGHYIPRDTLQAVAQLYRLLRELDAKALSEVIQAPDLGR
ncbi:MULTISPECIES: type III secretion system export apparatus subunit SctU [unclassified Pseudomonas]|uniref:type III secretion system export apparatus subunit SctU n=1 Tax=unclassified Pseudomonas TaxID=196821 RepID=UPI002361E232|nr:MULTISPECIES: type III secretion system export apparatus subunit SctU [unclassified Pseudomonas]